MKRTETILQYLFAGLGAAMLAGTVYLSYRVHSFVGASQHAAGEVVALDENEDGAKPIVRFTDRAGRMVEFQSSVRSKPPSNAVGDRVEVLYDPAKPEGAEINGFFSLWLGPLILGGLGAIFFAIGAGWLLFKARRRGLEQRLRREGRPVMTKLQSVALNTSYSVNGVHPFRVCTQWLNPATAQVRVFQSDNLWFDPSEFIGERDITVFIDPANPNRYCMDLGFLPQQAG